MLGLAHLTLDSDVSEVAFLTVDLGVLEVAFLNDNTVHG
jgi:hypothetical protein